MFRILPYTIFLAVAFLFSSSLLAQEFGKGSDQLATSGDLIALPILLEDIGAHFKLNLVYDNQQLAGRYGESKKKWSADAEKAMLSVLEPHGFGFRKVNDSTYAIIKRERLPASKAKSPKLVKVTGLVTDYESGEPLIGVNVRQKGGTSGAVTDFEGNFSLSIEDGTILVFSYLGYLPLELKAVSKRKMDVRLRPNATQLDEVVVVGYGTQKRSDVTGALSSVGEEELKALPVTGLDQALQGRAAGVYVTQNSGAPGGAVSIRIRGIGSTLTAEPLYVIDGVPVINDNQGTSQNFSDIDGGGQHSNALNTINPNDIESIEILKDASATAIYGARGANGVVLITTKRGKAGRSKISLESYYGTQQLIRELPVLDLRQYAEYYGSQPFVEIEEFENLDLLGSGTNWQQEIFRTAIQKNVQLTLSGGSEKTTFALSGGFADREGIVVGSAFERFSGKLNLDHKISDRVRVGNSLLISRTAENITLNDNTSGVVFTGLLYVPNAPVRNADGTFAGPQEEIELAFINPVSRALEIENFNRKTRILSNLYFEADLLSFLKYRTEFGSDILFANTTYFQPAYERGSLFANSSLQKSINRNTFWVNKHLLTFDKQLGERNHLNALAGFEIQEGGYEWLFARRNDLVNNDARELNLGDAGQQDNGGGAGDFGLVSYFTRINYSFDDRYQLTGTLRIDGSSRFGANNRYGTFPSAAFAWRVSNEPFLKRFEKLDNLKIRVGYGSTGNQEIGLYAYTSNLRALAAVQGDRLVTSFVPANIANPDVRWESSTQTNIGLDLGLFKNRVELIADYYVKRAEGMLLPALIPTTAGGLEPPFVNIGELENSGLELTLNTQNTTGKVDWRTSINFTTNNNRVINLGSNGSLTGIVQRVPVTRTEVGGQVGQFFGHVVDGIFQSQGEVDEAPFQTNDTRAGDIRFKDLNDDGVVNDEDRTFIGSPLPDFTLNLNNSISFAGFDFSFLFQGVFGNDVLNMVRTRTESFEGFGNQSTLVLDRWTTDNPSTSIPRSVPGDPNNNTRVSDRFVEDGSFIRLRNVGLGYELPTALIQRINLRRLRFYVSAQNLFTITDYQGYDPEIGSFNQNPLINGVDNGRYPIAKSFTFGLNLDF